MDFTTTLLFNTNLTMTESHLDGDPRPGPAALAEPDRACEAATLPDPGAAWRDAGGAVRGRQDISQEHPAESPGGAANHTH